MAYRSPYPDIIVPDLNLFEQVFQNAASHREAIAMADGVTGRTITYGSLLEQIRQTAAGLAARGIKKGDVVSLWSPNVPEWPIVFFAVIKLGAIVHTSNPVSTPEELAFQLTDGGVKMLFTVSALADKAKAAIAESRRSIELFTIDETPGIPPLASIAVDRDPPVVSIDPANDLCVLPYSSGTTGLPKGVMLTHRNLVAQLNQIDAIESVATPALLGVLPFFHIYGMVILVMHGLMRGSTIVTMQKFEFEPFLKVLQDWPIVTAHVVPPIVVGLGKHPAVDHYKFPHLKYLFSGAAPLGPELTDAVEKRLKVKIRQGYGMTEASPATHYTVAGTERSGTAGRLMPSIEMRIIDPETGRDLPSGQPGEVWVRGPNVMKGYLNNPDATSRTVDAEGWLHTGDIGVADDDGYLTVVDRLKELIKVKGFQVAPAELESLLLKHPQIADVAVIPVADDHCGEVPKAIIVKRDSLTAEEVIEFLKPKVAHYKCVKHVAFVDAIPKSPSGKILRRVLVAQERAQA
ncbi:MAG TPA: AMP-binding protein [Vicinamibacterales bacterium]|nr:AMP-binding protein [Vicinamibacterales bacterium]